MSRATVLPNLCWERTRAGYVWVWDEDEVRRYQHLRTRRLSAYMFFANEQRDNVREENPGISFGKFIRTENGFHGFWRKLTFELSPGNFITHYIANQVINRQPGGADEILEISFSAYIPAIHRYFPHAVDSLAKLLARGDPNRSFYRAIVAVDSSSTPPYDLLTRAFGLAIAAIPEYGHLNTAGLVKLRAPYLVQGLLAAEIIVGLKLSVVLFSSTLCFSLFTTSRSRSSREVCWTHRNNA